MTDNTLTDPGSDPANEWKRPDAVNHPGHYTSHPSGIECIQVTEHMSFCLGNAIKYIWRADLKGNAIEDLQKARWYVDREIARLGGGPAVLDEPAAEEAAQNCEEMCEDNHGGLVCTRLAGHPGRHVAHVLQLVNGQHRQVATVHYTHEQAAKVAMQLLGGRRGPIGGKR